MNLTPYIKNQLKMDHELKCKTKLLEKLGENLWDLGLGKQFLDLTPKVQSIRDINQ